MYIYLMCFIANSSRLAAIVFKLEFFKGVLVGAAGFGRCRSEWVNNVHPQNFLFLIFVDLVNVKDFSGYLPEYAFSCKIIWI